MLRAKTFLRSARRKYLMSEYFLDFADNPSIQTSCVPLCVYCNCKLIIRVFESSDLSQTNKEKMKVWLLLWNFEFHRPA